MGYIHDLGSQDVSSAGTYNFNLLGLPTTSAWGGKYHISGFDFQITYDINDSGSNKVDPLNLLNFFNNISIQDNNSRILDLAGNGTLAWITYNGYPSNQGGNFTTDDATARAVFSVNFAPADCREDDFMSPVPFFRNGNVSFVSSGDGTSVVAATSTVTVNTFTVQVFARLTPKKDWILPPLQRVGYVANAAGTSVTVNLQTSGQRVLQAFSYATGTVGSGAAGDDRGVLDNIGPDGQNASNIMCPNLIPAINGCELASAYCNDNPTNGWVIASSLVSQATLNSIAVSSQGFYSANDFQVLPLFWTRPKQNISDVMARGAQQITVTLGSSTALNTVYQALLPRDSATLSSQLATLGLEPSTAVYGPNASGAVSPEDLPYFPIRVE